MLLFGKDDVIRSCCPGYITDALYRVENLGRYDDRLQVTTNLIEAYDLLMEFVAKHTSDKFCLINNIRDMKVVKAVNGKGKGKYVFIE